MTRTAKIAGEHRYVEGARALNHHKIGMRLIGDGETLYVAAGEMVGIKMPATAHASLPMLIEAVENVTITGPMMVSAPAPSQLDAIARDEVAWENGTLMKAGFRLAFLAFILIIGVEMLVGGMQMSHYGLIAAAFCVPYLIMVFITKLRGHGRVYVRDVAIFEQPA